MHPRGGAEGQGSAGGGRGWGVSTQHRGVGGLGHAAQPSDSKAPEGAHSQGEMCLLLIKVVPGVSVKLSVTSRPPPVGGAGLGAPAPCQQPWVALRVVPSDQVEVRIIPALNVDPTRASASAYAPPASTPSIQGAGLRQDARNYPSLQRAGVSKLEFLESLPATQHTPVAPMDTSDPLALLFAAAADLDAADLITAVQGGSSQQGAGQQHHHHHHQQQQQQQGAEQQQQQGGGQQPQGAEQQGPSAPPSKTKRPRASGVQDAPQLLVHGRPTRKTRAVNRDIDAPPSRRGGDAAGGAGEGRVGQQGHVSGLRGVRLAAEAEAVLAVLPLPPGSAAERAYELCSTEEQAAGVYDQVRGGRVGGGVRVLGCGGCGSAAGRGSRAFLRGDSCSAACRIRQSG